MLCLTYIYSDLLVTLTSGLKLKKHMSALISTNTLLAPRCEH